MSLKRSSTDSNGISLSKVKKFMCDDPIEEVVDYYRKHQVVVIKNAIAGYSFGINDIKALHTEDPELVDETFSMEAKKGELGWGSHSSSDLFGKEAVKNGQWYASFIAQKKVPRGPDDIISTAYGSFKKRLPLTTLPTEGSRLKIKYTEPIWVFVGQNDQKDSFLKGRPEHIDSVHHDGTWHFQSSGSKVWYIRPADTKEWGDKPVQVSADGPSKKRKGTETVAKADPSSETFTDGLGRLKVVVEKGDILIINTRVWWHQTRIPYTGPKDYSISYAIDFFAKDLCLPGKKEIDESKSKMEKSNKSDKAAVATKGAAGDAAESDEEGGQEYSNIDGLYASKALKSGDVVFYEAELPDCALPRSDDPTCEIVWLEDGTGALFALKDLAVGDWLTVAPSDDEESDGSDDGEEDSNEGSEEGSEGDWEEEECCEEGSGEEEESEDEEEE
eukprot:gene15520-17744_t